MLQQEYTYYTLTNANDITIDKEFKRILPVLSEKELASIEKNHQTLNLTFSPSQRT
ncbi:MAG: hypothetical protein FWE83_01120 [Oscillospiraceae bacterium]|nr:hypothetical protein [Oscillospiraceae bacterium]